MRFGVNPAALYVSSLLILAINFGSIDPTFAQEVIEDLQITEGGSEAEINVRFATPLTYVSHSPRTRGDRLVIDLRAAPGGEDAFGVLGNERKQISGREVPLAEVRFEGESAAGQQLILEFDRPVDFRVEGSPSGQGVTVFVSIDTPPQSADLGTAVPPPRNETASVTKALPRTPNDPIAAPTAEPTLPALSDERLEETWQEAKRAMTDKDFSRAVQLYTKLLQHPQHKYTQQSQEFLGLARERNGQLPHAKSEYEAYLSLYPEGADADRVRQRLAGIVTSRSEAQGELRDTRRSEEDEEDSLWADWDFLQFGGISEFYAYRKLLSEDFGNEVIQNDFFTDADYSIRASNERFDIRGLFVGGHAYSLIKDQEESEFNVSALDVDILDQKLGLSARLGRQRQNNSGILGRFDGGFFGYQVHPKAKVNAFAGFPVQRRTDGVRTDRYFTGGSVEFQPFSDAWAFTVFGLNQEADGITDRRAVGSAVNYASSNFFGFSLLDYDVLYDDLNLALLNGTYLFDSGATINAAIDYRNSPILTTTNAIQGQGVEDLSELDGIFDEDELRDLAEARTARSQSYTLGASYPLNEQLQLLGDITVTKFGSTDSLGGVEGSPATGYDMFYSTQAVATNFLTENDITIFGLRFADTDRAKTISGDVNFRYSLGRQWRFNPRLRGDYRFDEEDDGSRWRLRPSMAIDYRFLKRGNIELEIGGEWANEEFIDDIDQDGDDDEEIIESGDFFVTVGTRVDF